MSQLSHAQFPLRRHPNLLVDHRRSRSAAVAEPRGANGEAVTGSGGRLHFGMVAGIKSERWPTSNRNPRPDCLGIRNLANAIDAEVLLEYAPDLDLQIRIAADPARQPGGIGPPRDMDMIGRRGDRQDLADRLDPVNLTMIVDEGDHGLNGRSSSAWAKYADALRRISFAWRSSRFSRSSAFRRSAISAGTPPRTPLAISAFLTHSLSDCAVQPILAAIEVTAAHREE